MDSRSRSKQQEESAKRSEQLRQRRTVRSQEHLNNLNAPASRNKPRVTRSGRGSSSTGMASVVVRGGRYGVPLVEKTRSGARKQIAISLNNSGAELLLPAFPTLKAEWRYLSGFLVVIMTALLFVFWKNPQYQVDRLQIVGVERLNTADIESYLRLGDKPIFLIDPAMIEEKLSLAFPELMDVSVEVGMPAKVIVSASEREPVLVWYYSNLTLWIDEDGYIFPARGSSDGLVEIRANSAPPVMPQPIWLDEYYNERQIEMRFPTQRVDPKFLKAAVMLNGEVPPESSLVYSSLDGLGWYDPRGWNVYIGLSSDDISVKMMEYRVIVDDLEQKGVRPSMISVEHVHAPFYRLEP